MRSFGGALFYLEEHQLLEIYRIAFIGHREIYGQYRLEDKIGNIIREKLHSKEYVELLRSDEPASTRFWDLEERIKGDKRLPGVRLRLEKKNVDVDLMRLFKLGVIEEKDLEGFSDELVERVMELVNIKW